MAATKFAEFLSAQKLDPRRVIAESRKLEKNRTEDRQIRLKKRLQKAGEAPAEGTKETRKARSGRPVTPRAMDAAMTGKATVSGPTKSRILKAVNSMLERKKQNKVELKALF